MKSVAGNKRKWASDYNSCCRWVWSRTTCFVRVAKCAIIKELGGCMLCKIQEVLLSSLNFFQIRFFLRGLCWVKASCLFVNLQRKYDLKAWGMKSLHSLSFMWLCVINSKTIVTRMTFLCLWFPFGSSRLHASSGHRHEQIDRRMCQYSGEMCDVLVWWEIHVQLSVVVFEICNIHTWCTAWQVIFSNPPGQLIIQLWKNTRAEGLSIFWYWKLRSQGSWV